MSMLGMQADELRGYALSVRNVALRTTSLCHEARRDLLDSAARMEQAANTIESLRDRLQELQGVDGESNYTRLFGTPERAMRTIALIGNRYPCDEGCDPSGEKCKVCPFADAPSCRIKCDYPEESPLLEWLKGASE